MTKVLVAFSIFITPFLIYVKFVVNKIRFFDMFCFKWLEKKNVKLGAVFHWLKISCLVYGIYIFIESSIYFYKDIWALENEAFYLAIICFIPLHLGFVYNVLNLLFDIYHRKFVYFDEIFKIVLLTYTLDFLSIFVNELAFVPIKEIWKNSKGSGSGGVRMSMLPNADNNKPSSVIREVGKFVRNSLVHCTARLRSSPPPEDTPIFRDAPSFSPEESEHLSRETRVNQGCGTATMLWRLFSKDKLEKLSKYSIVQTQQPDSPTGPSAFNPLD